jgi:hypothetical protein
VPHQIPEVRQSGEQCSVSDVDEKLSAMIALKHDARAIDPKDAHASLDRSAPSALLYIHNVPKEFLLYL